MIAAVRRGWDRFWFSYSDQYHYGVLRVLLLGYLAFLELRNVRSGSWLGFVRDAPLELFHPCFAARWLSPPPEWIVEFSAAIQIGLLILGFLAAVGMFTRCALVGYTYLFLIKQGFLNSFGVFYHHTPLVLVVLITLCLCRGSTTLSVDALMRSLYRRFRGRPWQIGRLFFGEPTQVWPARLILLFLAVFYATSGVSKIRHGGWQWMDGRTLAFNLSEKRAVGYFTVRPGTEETEKWRDGFGLEAFVYDYGHNTSLGHKLSGSPRFTQIGAVTTVLFEILAPLILLSRRLCYVYFAGLILFSFCTGATLGLNFLQMYWPVCALVIDWNVLGWRLLRMRRSRCRGRESGNATLTGSTRPVSRPWPAPPGRARANR